MLAAERQNRILDEVRLRGGRAGQRALPAARRLGHDHPAGPRRAGGPERARQGARRRDHEAVAVALVEPGSASGLSAGTTTWTLARQLAGVPDLTVVTNSTRVADVLLASGRGHGSVRSAPHVILTGGVRTPSDALVGPVAVTSLGSLHQDLVFLGVHGMDPRAGYTTPDMLEADAQQILRETVDELVVATSGAAAPADVEVADRGDDGAREGRPLSQRLRT